MKRKLAIWTGLMACFAFVAWKLDSNSKPQDLGHGATFIIKRIGSIKLQLVFFEESKTTLRVVSNTDRASGQGLDAWGHSTGALAVCNGGYFEVGKLLPSGIEISQGKRSGTLLKREWGGGFGVKDGRPALIWDEEFHDDPKLTDYLQCSPWLVSDGRPWPMPKPAKPEPKNARTFILTDQAGHWAIGIAENVGLLELAEILVTPGVVTEFTVKRALNLDGGPSTGLWFKTADGRENLDKPGWIVRNGIAIVPR